MTNFNFFIDVSKVLLWIMRKSFFMVDNLPPETFIQIAKEYFSCFSHMEILFIHKICTVFYPSFLLYPQSPGFAFLRLFLYNVCIDFNDFRSKITRAKKGHEGVKGTVAEDYQGILVHDHDITFYSYGTEHQECLAHVLRYLKDSMDNEPDRTWNKEMRSLVQEMIHFRNECQPFQEPDPVKVSEFEKRYREILEIARAEYGNVPANNYYRDGYNLFLRMEKYMQNNLMFLHDSRVPATNNEAERRLRSYKRKQAQAVTFRSFESIDYLCQCMSMLVLVRLEEPANIFDRVSRIFG